MNAKDKIDTLNKMIANEKAFIKFTWGMAILIVFVALVLTGIAWKFNWASNLISDNNKWLNALPLGLGGSIGGIFSFKDYPLKRNRILVFNILKDQYEKCENDENPPDPAAMVEIDKRFWNLLDNNLK